MIEPNPVAEDPMGKMDDFQQIKGIGPSIAQALYDSGIHRFTDLAKFTADELVNLLSPKVGFMTTQRIERDDWLGQARALASIQKVSSNDVEPCAEIQHKNHVEHRQADWREIADFFVSFGYAPDSQGEMSIHTRVHHSQADCFEQWQGIAISKLIDWMMDQAKLSALEKAKEPSDVHRPFPEQIQVEMEREEQVQIDLNNLWVSQVQVPELVNGVPRAGLIRLDSRITLSGPDAFSLTYERIPYYVQAYLVNTDNNQSECVSIHAGQLSPEELSYEIQQDFPTPKRGRYQINMIGQLSLPGTDGAIRTLFSYLQGPTLRVET